MTHPYRAPGDPRRPTFTRLRQYVDELREYGLIPKRLRVTPEQMSNLVHELGCWAIFIRDGVHCQFHSYGRGSTLEVDVVTHV